MAQEPQGLTRDAAYSHLWSCSTCYPPTGLYCKAGARLWLAYVRACGATGPWQQYIKQVVGQDQKDLTNDSGTDVE